MKASLRKPDTGGVESLKAGHHVALMYRTEDEHRAAIVPYLRKGLELGEKVLYIIDSHKSDLILEYLRDDGMDIDPYVANGQFNLIYSDDAYMKEGSFNPHRVIDTLWDERGRALATGFPSLRITSEMSWVIRNPDAIEQLIIYEEELNRFFPSRQGYGNCLAICQYDLRRFPPEMLLDIIVTHPLVITSRTVCENHHYLAPDDFFSPDRSSRTLHQLLRRLKEQRLEEDQLKKLEEQYRLIYENHPLGLQLYDSKGKLLSVNRTCLEIFGVHDIAVMAEFNLLQNLNLTRKVLEKSFDGNTVRFETNIDFSRLNFLNLVDSRKSGVMYLEVCVTELMPGEKGFRGGYLLCIQDITRRKRDEQFLKKSEDRFRAVIEVATDAIISCDSTGNIISWNNGAEVMFGQTSDDMIGRTVTDIIGAQYRKDFEEGLERLSTTGKAPTNPENTIEIMAVRQNGIEFPGEITISRWKAGSGDFYTVIIRDITERKKIEAELRMKESAISSSINPVALLDLQSNITYVNKSFLTTWGYDDEKEIIGRPATSFWQSPADAPHTISTIPGKGWIGELNAHKKNGSSFRVQLSSTVVPDDFNHTAYVVASFVDLSGEQERGGGPGGLTNLVTLMNATEDYFTAWDADLKLQDLNQAASRLFFSGMTREQLAGKDIFAVFTNLEKQTWLPKLREVLSTGQTLSIENVRFPGAQRRTNLTLSVIKVSSGLGIIASERHITQQELRERAAQLGCLTEIGEIAGSGRRPQEAWQAIADAAVKLVRYKDRAGACVYIGNEEYSSERFGNYPWKIAAPIQSNGKDIGRLELVYNEHMPQRENGPFSYAEHQALAVAASVVASCLPRETASAIPGSRPGQSRYTDTTLAMVREIKTRLTPILASSDLLAGELEGEPWKEIAESINRGTIKLDEKVNAMLDLARTESGTLVMDIKPVSVADVVNDAVKLIEPVLAAYRQSLETDLPRKLPDIPADRKRLGQVLFGFLEIASKLTPAGGTIKIKARKNSRNLDIEVHDPSKGLTEEQVRYLEQSQPATAGNEPLSGLGFGLALSKKLIELHKGTMWIRNEKGKGNTFGCSLPTGE